METIASPEKRQDGVLAQLFAEQRRLWRRALNSPRALALALAPRVDSTPHQVVLQQDAFRLLRYRGERGASYAPPVLFCYALINRSYIFDLEPDKSVVRRYLERGFDVYLIDWGAPSHADRGLALGDYVCRFLASAVDIILREHRRQNLHLLGYCMGGTMAALFTALYPHLVKSLTLLAAPIDFSGQNSLLNVWTDQKYFDVDALVGTHGNCPAWFLQSLFLQMKPVQNIIEKSTALYEQMDSAERVSSYFAMERWLNDNVPVAGETFRQFVKNLYQRNELVRGEFQLGEDRVDLSRITCPLLLMSAKHDHLVAPSSTEGIRPHVGSRDIESMTVDAGHVGLVVGGKAQRTVWPQATRWLADRSLAD